MKKQVLLLCALSLFLAVGCGEDKGSAEAKRFETAKNLDSGNYQAVLSDPNANATDFAAAAMVAAGLDPVDLVKQLNTTASTTAGTTSGDLGAVTQIPIAPENLRYLVDAENKLNAEITTKCSGMTATTVTQECKDLNFQQTVTSLTTTITALAQVGQTNSASIAGGFDPTNGISQAEATALATYITNNPNVTVNTGTTSAPNNISIVTVVATDVATIAGTTGTNGALALSGLGGSELETTLNSITTGTNSINPTGGTVTSSDITAYLNTNFAK